MGCHTYLINYPDHVSDRKVILNLPAPIIKVVTCPLRSEEDAPDSRLELVHPALTTKSNICWSLISLTFTPSFGGHHHQPTPTFVRVLVAAHTSRRWSKYRRRSWTKDTNTLSSTLLAVQKSTMVVVFFHKLHNKVTCLRDFGNQVPTGNSNNCCTLVKRFPSSNIGI